MRRRAHLRTSPPRRLWSRVIWPLLAGAVSAVGVFAVGTTLGVLALVLMYAGLAVFAVTMSWGLSIEMGIERFAAVGHGFSAALVVLVAVGLCLVHPEYGLLVVVVVGLSSPTALSLLAKIRPRTTRRPRTDRVDLATRPAPGVLVDKVILDRRFDEIVSQLMESGDFPEG